MKNSQEIKGLTIACVSIRNFLKKERRKIRQKKWQRKGRKEGGMVKGHLPVSCINLLQCEQQNCYSCYTFCSICRIIFVRSDLAFQCLCFYTEALLLKVNTKLTTFKLQFSTVSVNFRKVIGCRLCRLSDLWLSRRWSKKITKTERWVKAMHWVTVIMLPN